LLQVAAEVVQLLEAVVVAVCYLEILFLLL
jgi:hypothetical protein